MAATTRAKTDRRRKPRTAPTVAMTVPAAEIAGLAYQYYCARGRQDGGDLDDWLRAERALASLQKMVGPTQ